VTVRSSGTPTACRCITTCTKKEKRQKKRRSGGEDEEFWDWDADSLLLHHHLPAKIRKRIKEKHKKKGDQQATVGSLGTPTASVDVSSPAAQHREV
jgi:hypothetical protein